MKDKEKKKKAAGWSLTAIDFSERSGIIIVLRWREGY